MWNNFEFNKFFLFTAKSSNQEQNVIFNYFTSAYFQARSQQIEPRTQWQLQ